MRVRVNTLLVSCILLTIATVMMLVSAGIKSLINTPNNLVVQSAGYGALAMIVIVVFVTWTGLVKSDWRAWVVIAVVSFLWEYPIFAHLYVKHYGLALPIGILHELVFIGTDSKAYIEELLGIFGCFLSLLALALSAIAVFGGKGKEVNVGRGLILTSVAVVVVLLAAGAWERLHETSISREELKIFMVLPPPPPPPLPEPTLKLPTCDPLICNCAK